MKTVLVVDDQRDVADSIALILEMYGYTVHVAYDAMQALAVVAENTPDVAVLDLGMPRISGYELAQKLRALRGTLLYLIAHSAWDDERTKRRIATAGFDAHLTKPASVPELIATIG